MNRWALVVCLCLGSVSDVVWSQTQHVALLVGVNQYDKRGFANKPLKYAERDVEAMAAELKKQGYQVRLLTGSQQGKERAIKENIDAAIAEVLQGRNARDIVLIGLAGHGVQMAIKGQEDAFFCPADAVMGEAKSMISLTGLMQTLDRKGGINLVLVDACRDNPDPGRSTRSLTGNELNGKLPSNTAILFSCAAGQQALETKDAGGGHGVFFYHVLEGIKGQAANRRNEVTWGLLVEYLRETVNPRAKEWFPEFVSRAENGRLQTPHELKNLVDSPILALVSSTSTVPPPVIPPKVERIPPTSGDTFAGSRSGQEWDGNGLKMKFCWCPPGKFMMGSPATEQDRDDDEAQYSVTLAQGFWLGKYEVTQGEWEQVMGTKPWSGKTNVKEGASYAANYVSWDDAVNCCQKLTTQERQEGRLPNGWEYCLPSEAHWEYACRAGTTTAYSFGDDVSLLRDYAWYDKNAYNIDEKYSHAVGQKKSNAWGLNDMHGNLYEWCQDWYADKLPVGTDSTGSDRVCRGGSWFGYGLSCRSGNRDRYAPSNRFYDRGFRVALVPSSK